MNRPSKSSTNDAYYALRERGYASEVRRLVATVAERLVRDAEIDTVLAVSNAILAVNNAIATKNDSAATIRNAIAFECVLHFFFLYFKILINSRRLNVASLWIRCTKAVNEGPENLKKNLLRDSRGFVSRVVDAVYILAF